MWLRCIPFTNPFANDSPPTEFYTKDHRELAHDWLRFAVCKVYPSVYETNCQDLDTLEEAVGRLRKLKPYIHD